MTSSPSTVRIVGAGFSLSWARRGVGWAIGVFVGTLFSRKSLNGAP